MEKKYQIIYIWSFIIISGLILLLLYTPLGGDLHNAAYREQYRYNVSPGVNYSNQVGSFSGSSSYGGSYNSSNLPSAYVSPSLQGVISGGYSGSLDAGKISGYSGGGGITLSNKTNSGGAGAGGGSGFGMMAVGGKSSGGVSNTFSGGGSIGGSLFNSTNASNGGVMQRAGNSEDDSDPGGDPTGPPLPVGDELGILFLFAALFSLYKWLRLNSTK